MQILALSADHPGFHDRAYRSRRNAIAALAERHVQGMPSPRVRYVSAEQRTWSTVWRELLPLHRSLACGPIQRAQEELALWKNGIPQLTDLGPALAATGFRFEPVAGLVAAPVFLRALAEGVFLSTQYVRHSSRPFYTPEPDVIHELVGHAASLTVPEVAELSRAFGRAAQRTNSPERLLQLERLYWFTLEFGAVLEEGAPRAVGAGLLSSVDELERVERRAVCTWSVERLARTPYDPTTLQPAIYTAPSWAAFIRELRQWLARTSPSA